MATLYQLAVVAALFVVLSSEGLRVGVVLDREGGDWTIRTSVYAELIWTGGRSHGEELIRRWPTSSVLAYLIIAV